MPKPPERLNNTDKFSTFIVVDNRQGDRVLQWQTQANLRRNLALYQKYNPQFAALFIDQAQDSEVAQFWLNLALNDAPPAQDWEPANRKLLALEHLAAYLDKICYWAAKNVCGNYSDRPWEKWEDYFAIARNSFYNPDKFINFLQKYNPDRGANLETYMKGVLTNTIKDKAQVDKFSIWRSLYKKTDEKLRAALKANGNIEPHISLVIFAHTYFKKVYRINRTQNPHYVPGEKWLEPTQKILMRSQIFTMSTSYYPPHLMQYLSVA